MGIGDKAVAAHREAAAVADREHALVTDLDDHHAHDAARGGIDVAWIGA